MADREQTQPSRCKLCGQKFATAKEAKRHMHQKHDVHRPAQAQEYIEKQK